MIINKRWYQFNTEHTSGLVTQMATKRNWLVKIHCINCQVEVTVKDMLLGSISKGIN